MLESLVFPFLLLLIPSALGVLNFPIIESFSEVYRNVESASAKCQQQLGSLSQDTILHMLDASTKIPEGILLARLYHLGNYDECYGIHQKPEGIYGKYCLGTLQANLSGSQDSQKNLQSKIPRYLLRADKDDSSPFASSLQMAYCVPSGCSAKDMTIITSGLLVFDEQYCYSKDTEPELSGGAIAAITILSIFGGIVLVSTLYDLWLFYTSQNAPNDVLLAFSAFSNGKKLITATTNQDQLLCLNGIKAISMMWVVFGHVYQNAMAAPLTSFADILSFMNDPANMFLLGAMVSVDTFFLVGGLVIVYVFMRSMDKGVKFNIVMYYIHRYIRLTPILGIVILVEATLMDYMGDGPTWGSIPGVLTNDCKDYWWSTLLYIQNFVHGSNDCIPQSWYLSVDFQLFLLTPLVLIPLHRWGKIGLGLLGLLIVGGVIIPWAIVFHYKISGLGLDFSKMDDYMWKFYKQPWTRYGPYVIGMLLGYFIYQVKSKKLRLPKLPPLALAAAWLVSLGGMVGCVWGPYANVNSTGYDRWAISIQMATVSNAWAVSVGGVIFLCIAGYGGPVDWFLSLPIFQFLSKISYATYLVHYQLIVMRYATTRVNVDFSHRVLMLAFWGDFIYSLAVATMACLAFESPMIILEKIIFGTGGSKKRKIEVQTNNGQKLAEP